MRYMNLLNDLTIDCKNNGGCYRVKDQLKKVKYLLNSIFAPQETVLGRMVTVGLCCDLFLN